MTLKEMSYQIMELLEKELTDDFYIDIRLVKAFIKDQYKLELSNALNKKNNQTGYGSSAGYDGGYENFIQRMTVSLDKTTSSDLGYDCYSSINYWKSDAEIPDLATLGRRPSVIRIIPQTVAYEVQPTIEFSTYDRALYTGNGRFNSDQMIGFIANKNLYVASSGATTPDPLSVIVDAILSDPTELPGFDEDTDDFPGDKLWPYMQEPILSKLLIKFKVEEDRLNDASHINTMQEK